MAEPGTPSTNGSRSSATATPVPLAGARPRGAIRVLRRLGLERPARRYVLPLLRSIHDQSSALPEERRLHTEAKRLARDALLERHPVVVGPWLSEVGFEVLYWIPFLLWLKERVGLDSGRMVAVSRGGTRSWYAGVCDGYREIFDEMTVSEFRELTEARWNDVGGQKQMELNKWDRAVLGEAASDLGWNRHSVLHPSLMYRMFRPFWRGKSPIGYVLDHLKFERFQAPEPGEWTDRLPDEFVAVKFYFRPSFPDTLENRRIVTEIVEALAERTSVVLLNSGLSVDDHVEVDPQVEDRVTWLLRDVPPEQNLHVQSIAISRARGFVGTYGGLSYLAPAYGVPSVALYSNAEHFLPSHLEVAHRAAAATSSALTVLGPEQLDLAKSLGVIGLPGPPRTHV